MRIGIDARKLHDFGIGTYIRNLLRQLARLDRQTEFVVLRRPADREALTSLGGNLPEEPVYAAVEGVALGGISVVFEARYPGIVSQAVFLTFGTLGALLVAYRSGVIRATENFKLGVVAATGGIALLYLLSFVLGFFGVSVPLIHSSGTFGILFSLFVVVIAALNLVLDFDFIEQGVGRGAPKHMEWYGAFGLLVTLVWLYLEILHLLAKLQSRQR